MKVYFFLRIFLFVFQNNHLRNILQWQKNGNTLQSSLQALSVPVGETKVDVRILFFNDRYMSLSSILQMMRFMHPLLDSLFRLWEDKESLLLPAFDVIVAVLRITGSPNIPSFFFLIKIV